MTNQKQLEAIAGMKPEDLKHMTLEQRDALKALAEHLHSFNLGKAEKPNWDQYIRILVRLYTMAQIRKKAGITKEHLA